LYNVTLIFVFCLLWLLYFCYFDCCIFVTLIAVFLHYSVGNRGEEWFRLWLYHWAHHVSQARDAHHWCRSTTAQHALNPRDVLYKQCPSDQSPVPGITSTSGVSLAIHEPFILLCNVSKQAPLSFQSSR
jgi:hypothetical protein